MPVADARRAPAGAVPRQLVESAQAASSTSTAPSASQVPQVAGQASSARIRLKMSAFLQFLLFFDT